MDDYRFRCDFYVFSYFFSAVVAIAIGLLIFFGLLPIIVLPIAAVIAIAGLIYLITLGAKLNAYGGEPYRCHLPCCVLRHLAIESILTVLFGVLSLVLTFVGPLVAIPLALTAFAFLATLISATALIFFHCNGCRND